MVDMATEVRHTEDGRWRMEMQDDVDSCLFVNIIELLKSRWKSRVLLFLKWLLLVVSKSGNDYFLSPGGYPGGDHLDRVREGIVVGGSRVVPGGPMEMALFGVFRRGPWGRTGFRLGQGGPLGDVLSRHGNTG